MPSVVPPVSGARTARSSMRLRSSSLVPVEHLPFPQHSPEAFGLAHAQPCEPRFQPAAEDLPQPRFAVRATREEQVPRRMRHPGSVRRSGGRRSGRPVPANTRRGVPASATPARAIDSGYSCSIRAKSSGSFANVTSTGRERPFHQPRPDSQDATRTSTIARTVFDIFIRGLPTLQCREERDQRLLVRGRQRPAEGVPVVFDVGGAVAVHLLDERQVVASDSARSPSRRSLPGRRSAASGCPEASATILSTSRPRTRTSPSIAARSSSRERDPRPVPCDGGCPGSAAGMPSGICSWKPSFLPGEGRAVDDDRLIDQRDLRQPGLRVQQLLRSRP